MLLQPVTICLKNLDDCALISSGWEGPQSFLKDFLPGYNPQVGCSKIFHVILKLLIVWLTSTYFYYQTEAIFKYLIVR